jgi:N-acetylneuraminic acid mutarotase
MWSYDATNNTWSEITTSGGPSGRFNFQMAYSIDHHKIVVFSGRDVIFSGRISTGVSGDTWVYDVEQDRWEIKRPSPGPLQRSDAGFAYDESNKVFVMYGGLSHVDSDVVLDETWVYDLDENTWMEMTPENSPPRMYGCELVYDSLNQKVLLWGGNIRDGGMLDEFWCYDYQINTWTRLETNPKPRERFWFQMTFDQDIGKVVIFGGSPGGDAKLGDTWLYDYTRNEWTQINSSDNPSARDHSRMVYDSEIGKVVLFGGTSGFRETWDDTWILDTVNGEWSIAAEPTSAEREDDEPSQTGIPGFPLPAIILSMVLIMILLAGERRSSNGVISAQAG